VDRILLNADNDKPMLEVRKLRTETFNDPSRNPCFPPQYMNHTQFHTPSENCTCDWCDVACELFHNSYNLCHICEIYIETIIDTEGLLSPSTTYTSVRNSNDVVNSVTPDWCEILLLLLSCDNFVMRYD
jgi:hypothetical protein